MNEDLVFYLGVAVRRMGGELRLTEEEYAAFDAEEYSLKLDFPEGGDTVITVGPSGLEHGASSRVTMRDGTELTVMEAES